MIYCWDLRYEMCSNMVGGLQYGWDVVRLGHSRSGLRFGCVSCAPVHISPLWLFQFQVSWRQQAWVTELCRTYHVLQCMTSSSNCSRPPFLQIPMALGGSVQGGAGGAPAPAVDRIALGVSDPNMLLASCRSVSGCAGHTKLG